MRDKPDLWPKAERIQWGCVLMRMLGEDSLERLHVVLAGLRSIEHSRQAVSCVPAIRTARIILGELLTKSAVQSAVYDFQTDASNRSFTIDSKTLKFTAEYAEGLDPSIAAAEQLLNNGLRRKAYNFEMADPDKDLSVASSENSPIPIRMHGFRFPPPRRHVRTSQPRQPIHVSLCELQEIARQLDQEDAEAGRPSLDWTGRVDFDLRATTGNGLRKTDILDLSDLKHIIGLPGSGKTTLITLLCVLLKRRGQRVAVFFTSIGVAREYLETLSHYNVNVAMLMGRSGQTHLRHANRIAELIADEGEGGFGHTREGVALFATSCPLPAFADSWPADWKLGEAPCEKINEVGTKGAKLCPAWELCGRVKNQRMLVTADVWLGHVASSDTRVPAHTSLERLHYFELIAETFDLIIFDECDETQKVLDEQGALTLTLTGDADSLHIALQETTRLLAANQTNVSDSLLRYILQANEFERHMLRFLSEVRRLDQTGKASNNYADQLLTANFLIREALKAAGIFDLFNSRALSAISDFWERALYRAFFFRGEPEIKWLKAEKYASDLNLSVEEANTRWLRVTEALKHFLALDHAAEADQVVDKITVELAHLFRVPCADRIREQVSLLIAVGFTVASYQRLAKSARPLMRHNEIPNDLIFSKASLEMREQVPLSILGTFSAVRYRRSPANKGYEIDYLVMDTTPRLLMHRLHNLGRANVLLTSATSWLESSPEYHVDRKPDYVLSPRSGQVGNVRLYVAPKLHPSTGKPLRFSGGGSDREDNLRHMVTALSQTDVDELSELERAVKSVVTDLGRSRKAALIVNSYDQVRLVVERLNDVNPSLGERTRGVVDELPVGALRARYVLKGQVEALGCEADVDVVVFPITALGRGINIVFRTTDDDNGRAAVGSVYFLTRPHPAAGDLSLMISLLAQATQKFDGRDLGHLSLAEAQQVYNIERYRIYRRVSNLLARPMSASSLDKDTLISFASNLLVPILQTIGRGMRKRMPVEVYFVDAAWAPRSAEGCPESGRSSVLVIMQQVLNACLVNPDPDLHDIYHALYGVFQNAFHDIVGLIPPNDAQDDREDLFDPSSATSEAVFDGYDPDDQIGKDEASLAMASLILDENEDDEEE